MIADTIVLSSVILAGAFVAAWFVSPGLRVWIERPKYQFLNAARQYDRTQRVQHDAAEDSSS